MTTPYATSWQAYVKAGWPSVLPLPERAKTPPPLDTTGKTAKDPAPEQMQAWAEERPNANVALRMPEGVIALDYDAYHEGAPEAWQGDIERLGPLPATWVCTSRLDGSGKRLYRVPEGTKCRGKFAWGEIIQRHHRYVMAPPSINPDDEGREVFWVSPDGEKVRKVPRVDELPELPSAWLEALQTPPEPPAREHLEPIIARLSGEWCTPVKEAMAAYEIGVGSRYDSMVRVTGQLANYAHARYPGAEEALEQVKREYIPKVADTRGPKMAMGEVSRAITGAKQMASRNCKLSLWTEERAQQVSLMPTREEPREFPCPVHEGVMAYLTARSGGCPMGCTYKSLMEAISSKPEAKIELPSLDIYPEVIAEELMAMHFETRAPLAYFALGALPVLAAALGSSYMLHVYGTWKERACFWVALTGESGKGKDPAIARLVAPLSEVERNYHTQNQKDMRDWEEADKRTRGGMPLAREILVQDFTVEALLATLDANKMGALLTEGELVGFVNSMGQYKGGGGNDRQHILNTFTGKEIKKNRSGKIPLYISNPTMSILGGLQPKLLNALSGDDGFRARFLFADGERLRADKFFARGLAGSEREAYPNWHSLIHRFVDRRYMGSVSLMELSKEAQEVAEPFLLDIENGKGIGSGDVPEMYRKMTGVLFRIALVVAHMEATVAGEKVSAVSGETMKKAVVFWQWCQRTAIQVLDQEDPMTQRDVDMGKKLAALEKFIERERSKGIKLTLSLIQRSGPSWCRGVKVAELREWIEVLGYDAGFNR